MGLPARLAKTALIWLGSHLPEAGNMRAESYGSQDKDHVGGFEQGFICRM